MARVQRLEKKMEEMLKDWEWEPVVRALAVARELCAFIWELQHIMRDKLPAPTMTTNPS